MIFSLFFSAVIDGIDDHGQGRWALSPKTSWDRGLELRNGGRNWRYLELWQLWSDFPNQIWSDFPKHIILYCWQCFFWSYHPIKSSSHQVTIFHYIPLRISHWDHLKKNTKPQTSWAMINVLTMNQIWRWNRWVKLELPAAVPGPRPPVVGITTPQKVGNMIGKPWKTMTISPFRCPKRWEKLRSFWYSDYVMTIPTKSKQETVFWWDNQLIIDWWTWSSNPENPGLVQRFQRFQDVSTCFKPAIWWVWCHRTIATIAPVSFPPERGIESSQQGSSVQSLCGLMISWRIILPNLLGIYWGSK